MDNNINVIPTIMASIADNRSKESRHIQQTFIKTQVS